MIDYILNRTIEEHTKEATFRYLQSLHQINLEENVENLTNINGGFVSRFEYFMPWLDNTSKESLLISGCAVGSEMIVAKKYGFKEVYGTEVTKEYVKIAKERLNSDRSLHVDYYNGKKLPYKNNSFSMICSGHIIEHTSSPIYYIKEHMRVLKRGGIFFIEFPDRYHGIELHTGLKSYESLPCIFRYFVLKYLAQNIKGYKDILEGLKPVSIWQIKCYCLITLNIFKILDIQKPAPGYIRMIIKKL